MFNPDPDTIKETIFSANDVAEAAQVWREARRRFAPDSQTDSRSVLTRLLQENTQPAACAAIYVARAIFELHGALTQKSVEVFGQKIRELFSGRDERQFDERVTELMVGAILSARVSPIAFEPYVPKEVSGGAPPSPDYAIRLPEGYVAIEVTVLHVDQFDAWSMARRQLIDGVRDRISKARQFVSVEIQMPINFDRRAAQVLLRRATLAPVIHEEQGERRIPVGDGDAVLKWQPLPVFRIGRDGHRRPVSTKPIPTNFFLAASGSGFNYSPIGDQATVERLAFSSLKNTLDRKRQQFTKQTEPYVLIVKSGHPWVDAEMLLDFFVRRVWPNPHYGWITAAAVLIPRTGYRPVDRRDRLLTSINQNATLVASTSLASLLAGEAGFHLYDGHFYATRELLNAARNGNKSRPV